MNININKTSNENTNKTALILPGGGARGSYQVGVVKAISEILEPNNNHFPIICGTSAGAINAAVLASHADEFAYGVSQLEKFWGGLQCSDIYRTDTWNILKTMLRLVASVMLGGFGVKAPKSLLDNAPLKQLLQRALRLEGIERSILGGSLQAVSLTASAYTTSDAISFYQGMANLKNWQRSRRQGVAQKLEVEHIMASAALPFLFPAQRLGTQYFGDGGLRMVAPLGPAIHLGASKILIIGTRDRHFIPEPETLVEYPSLGELGGYMLDTIFMDNLEADLSRLRRINHTLSLMTDEQCKQAKLRKIETFVIRPSVDIREITKEHANAIPRSVRFLLKSIGGWGSDWRMPSYLLFESDYTRALMDLGYRDAHSQAEEIRAFFNQ
ncbi:MAG: patatin-like phospholipase family protein [Xanthomonadales bacterium]|nr:patatin-like phospholipase family protein [Xanthomonadales bacterium]